MSINVFSLWELCTKHNTTMLQWMKCLACILLFSWIWLTLWNETYSRNIISLEHCVCRLFSGCARWASAVHELQVTTVIKPIHSHDFYISHYNWTSNLQWMALHVNFFLLFLGLLSMQVTPKWRLTHKHSYMVRQCVVGKICVAVRAEWKHGKNVVRAFKFIQ